MSTLKDVAKLANVDVSTVSRALNNTSYVHPETKKKILAAAKKLSYHPNIIAKALKDGQKKTLGLVVPKIQLTIFAEIIQAIELESRKYGYSILICSTDDDSKQEKECLERLRYSFVDGIIIAGTGKNNKLIQSINHEGMPVVQIIREQIPNISSVIADYEKCGYDAVKYLVSLNCKKIGLINGNVELATYRERYKGYKKAIQENGFGEFIVEDSCQTNTFEYGYNCAKEIISQTPDIDAILSAVDVQAIGVIRAIKEYPHSNNIKVMSLTGHSISMYLENPISVMEIPANSIGKQALILVLERIQNKEETKEMAKRIVFKPKLIIRD